MEFPNLVYRCPGTHQCPGGTFSYHPVNNEGELENLIKEGWYPTLPFAQDPGSFDLDEFLKVEEDIDPEDDLQTPDPGAGVTFKDLSREELEARAKELGIGFNKNTKDETLAERIIQAMEDED